MSSIFDPPGSLESFLREELARMRRRQEWNDRFTHWEKPASVTEEGSIDRAQRNVTAALSTSTWLTGQRVLVRPQGSYHNNTNVRTEADIDLRLVHPAFKMFYAPAVVPAYAQQYYGLGDAGATPEQLVQWVKGEAARVLALKFGAANVRVGNKAIRIKGITGSRAEVDVVPTIGYRGVAWLDAKATFWNLDGVAIYSDVGAWTFNFPEQHTANGIAKRARTAFRFKKVVRTFKRLRADMEKSGWTNVRVPSFLIECLVYAVEDAYFTVEADDRYSRVRRIAHRMKAQLDDPAFAAAMLEINEIKPLFSADQAWTYAEAKAFANAVVIHLGSA